MHFQSIINSGFICQKCCFVLFCCGCVGGCLCMWWIAFGYENSKQIKDLVEKYSDLEKRFKSEKDRLMGQISDQKKEIDDIKKENESNLQMVDDKK